MPDGSKMHEAKAAKEQQQKKKDYVFDIQCV